MRKSFAIILVIVFLTASFIIMAKPVSGATVQDNSWGSKAPMPVARNDLGVAVLNGKIYAIGGTNGGILSTNEEYNPLNNTWAVKTPMPTGRYNFATTVYQNKIYCIGGATGWNDGAGETIYSAVNEVYDPVTDSWTNETSIPKAVAGYVSAVIDKKIYH